MSTERTSRWIGCDEMRTRTLAAYDARGRRVSRVRACRAVEGGIEVRTLVFVDVPPFGYVTYPVEQLPEQGCTMAAIDADDHAVEAEMFIKGGYIRERAAETGRANREAIEALEMQYTQETTPKGE